MPAVGHTTTPPGPQPGCLPAGIWCGIIGRLDSYSCQQLRLAAKQFCSLVSAAMRDNTTLSLDVLGTADTADLAAKACVITPPRRPVALSILNHRQRCEQRLALFLDNLASPCTIQALDISTALHHISCSTLQLLVERLPQLHQLSLPPVATCGNTESDVLCMLSSLPNLCACDLDCGLFSRTPACSTLQACSSLRDGLLVQQTAALMCDNITRQQQQQHLLLHHATAQQAPHPGALQGDQQGARATLLPVQQQAEPCFEGQQRRWAAAASTDSSAPASFSQCINPCNSNETAAAFDSNRSSRADAMNRPRDSAAAASTPAGTSSTCGDCICPHTCAAPWSGLPCLSGVQHLRLQHLATDSLPAALKGVGRMRGLHTFSVTGLSQAAASLVLAQVPATRSHGVDAEPGAGGEAAAEEGEGRWLLADLQGLPALTRLEIGVDVLSTAPSSSYHRGTSSSYCAGGLVVPAHSGTPVGHPAAGPAPALSCSWSSMHLLQELVLHGICLDSAVFAATVVGCQQLTALHVGGIDLQQDVQMAMSSLTSSSLGLGRLRVLQADRYFSLGPHSAAVLFPVLTSLELTHAGSCSPDLRCLAHHPHLASLGVSAAAGDGSWSLHSLQLGHLVHLESLRELRLAENACEDDAGSPRGSCGSASPGRRQCGGLHRLSTGCCKGGSHWLPCCSAHLSAVTSLELRGPVTDTTLGQVPGQFPALKRLTVDSSYFASDGGLQKLSCAAELELLVLRKCSHITDYGLEVLLMGGSLKVVAVQDCARIDQRACHRIRKACRGGSQLLWYGCPTPASSNCSHAASHCKHSALSRAAPGLGSRSGQACSLTHDSSGTTPLAPAGSDFLHRCWREEQQQRNAQDCASLSMERPSSPVATLVAAATAVWLQSGTGDRASSATLAGSSAVASSTATHRQPGPGTAAGGRVRRVSGGCTATVHGKRRDDCWQRHNWGGAGSTLAH